MRKSRRRLQLRSFGPQNARSQDDKTCGTGGKCMVAERPHPEGVSYRISVGISLGTGDGGYIG
jgi:hypothetical protein